MRRLASWRTLAALFAVVLAAYAGLVGLRVLYPIAYRAQLVELSESRGLDPALVAAVVRCESRFRNDAVSVRGAIGLLQIMPETGAWIAEKLNVPDFTVDRLYDADVNLRFGTWYLRSLLDRFGDVSDALAAYNAGPNHVVQWRAGVGTTFPETEAYVARVTRSVPVYRFFFAAPWLLRITPSLLLSRCSEPLHGLDFVALVDVSYSTT